MANKSAQLDQVNAPAAVTGTTPMVSLDLLQDNWNLLVGAIIVAGSLPLLTAKLDADAGVTDTTYASLINPLTVGDVVAKFNTLTAKLDADTLVGDTNYAALLPATIANLRARYVALLAKLDADSGVSATNHGTTALLADFAGLLVTPLDSQ
jgi:hypothetical protein